MNAAVTPKDEKVKRKMKNDYPANRKSAVRLVEDEHYAIYKYCIENRCVHQIDAAIEWRMTPARIAEEIIKNCHKIVNEKKVSSYHVRTAVETTVGWQKRLGKLPVTPIETVELEQLKIYKAKTTREIEQFKVEAVEKSKMIQKMAAEIDRLKAQAPSSATIEQIRKLVGAVAGPVNG